jgi:hypothetical protein
MGSLEHACWPAEQPASAPQRTLQQQLSEVESARICAVLWSRSEQMKSVAARESDCLRGKVSSRERLWPSGRVRFG